MKFELHCHSCYSKGRKIPWEGIDSPKNIIKTAKYIGLSGIAITDHSSNHAWKEAAKEAKIHGIIFIPGIEIESGVGHVIGLGLSEFIENGLGLDETINQIHDQAGIAIAPHPFNIRGDGIRHGIKSVDAIEVFNALNLDKLSNQFTEIKANRLNKPWVSGSDAHTLEMIGIAPNIINAYDLDSLLRQIKKGKIKIEKNYIPLNIIIQWTRERLIRSYPDVLKYINNNYYAPKAVIAKFLLNRFIHSKSNYIWNALAVLGLGFYRIYAGFKMFNEILRGVRFPKYSSNSRRH